jgi:hypothetical protein
MGSTLEVFPIYPKEMISVGLATISKTPDWLELRAGSEVIQEDPLFDDERISPLEGEPP